MALSILHIAMATVGMATVLPDAKDEEEMIE